MGGTMTCVVCGKEHESDPNVESNWTCFEINSTERYYCCPDCLQDNAGSIEERYQVAMMKIIELRSKADGA